MVKGDKILLSIAIITLFLALSVNATDQVVINSRDWTDVYSGMLYAQILEQDGNYLIEETRGLILLNSLDITKNEVLLIESSNNAYKKNYDNDLESRGFSVEKLDNYDNLNLELATDIQEEIKTVLVMDQQYSYNSVPLAAYAGANKGYVLFADSDNIDDVEALISDIDPQELIIYGFVDREVVTGLQDYSPIIINQGDKYSNNIELLKLYEEKNDFVQYILAGGDVIEPGFFVGNSPVMLIGESSIPETIIDYFKESDVKHAVLIGNDQLALAKQLKDQADMSVMVKFAKGINQVQYTLDTIQLPTLDYRPIISEIVYNSITEELIITIENAGDSPVMTRLSINLLDQDNISIGSFGDEDVVFIPGNGVATRTYDASLNDLENELITARLDLLYGEEPRSLDSLLIDFFPVSFISFSDNTKIEIIDFYYDKTISRFIVIIENIGDETAYATAFIDNFVLNERIQRLGTDNIERLTPGDQAQIKIKAKLAPEDIENNEEVEVKIRYGAQRNFLIKLKEETMDMKIKDNAGLYIIIGGTLLLIIILLLVFIILKRKKPKKHHHVYHPVHQHHTHNHGHAHNNNHQNHIHHPPRF